MAGHRVAHGHRVVRVVRGQAARVHSDHHEIRLALVVGLRGKQEDRRMFCIDYVSTSFILCKIFKTIVLLVYSCPIPSKSSLVPKNEVDILRLFHRYSIV